MACARTNRGQRAGFTLIELLIVVAIIGLLLSLVAPRYWKGVDRSKEAVLREDLYLMRDQINKFYTDTGRYPESLDELVERKYLYAVPIDPLTERADSWHLSVPGNGRGGKVADVHSGAQGAAEDGTPYAKL